MDAHRPAHGPDVRTVDIQDTPDRLPAVSAAEALDDLDDDPSRCVSTGLRELDGALAAGTGNTEERGGGAAGVWRGQITEIWGPPGVGKTAMGIQMCASALSEGHGAVWVDCAYPTCGRRLKTVVDAARSSRQSKSPQISPERSDAVHSDDKEGGNEPEDESFIHYRCSTLAHFIALLCRPVKSTLPSGTAVVVVDSLSTLLNESFPKATDGQKNFNTKKGSGLSTRRLQTLQYVIGALQKLAATRNCAVVLLSQCATRIQTNSRAALIPAVNANVWEQGIAARLVLFKDWVWIDGKAFDTCFAGIQRAGGRKVDGLKKVFAFRVGEAGLFPVEYDDSEHTLTDNRSVKRKLEEADLEIPDSDDDYGWDPDDEAHLPPEPPQWQGSEDLIVGTQRSDDEDAEGDEEGVDEGEDRKEGVGEEEDVAQQAYS